jgi:hypothetical protein
MRQPIIEGAIVAFEVILLFTVIFVSQTLILARCPTCKKTIFPGSIGIVIATKNCVHCGAQVMDSEHKP